MSDIYPRVCNYIEMHGMTAPGSAILAAVSGGADSMCMLDLLIRYCKEHGIRLGVVHVDHGFREESASEAEYVSDFCTQKGIPFYLCRIERGSIRPAEEDARIRRYELIAETASAHGYDRVALAHNRQDRAETMLFNLFRGTGISGLTGIRPVRDMYIRPVMCLDRDEIEEHLRDEGIEYCTDRTNLEDDYARNRIRHHIITESESINDRSVIHMNELAGDVDEICDLICRLAKEAYDRCVEVSPDSDEVKVHLSGYIHTDHVIRMELIRMIIRDMTPHLKDITRGHINSIDELAYREGNGRVDLPYDIQAYREYDCIRILKKQPDGYGRSEGQTCGTAYGGMDIDLSDLSRDGKDLCIRTDDGSEVVFSLIMRDETAEEGLRSPDKYTKRFDYDKIDKLITLRFRGPGDRIVIDGAGHTKKLSRYMIESKIPERIRDDIPVLAAGNDVIWIIGYRDSCAYRIDAGTHRVLEARVNNAQIKGE